MAIAFFPPKHGLKEKKKKIRVLHKQNHNFNNILATNLF